ncbi:tRNA (adenosine(37)-N6)-threonylcarbamoyltransferase complex ATPase subunit type 1 TsaE [Leptolyngbya ohadii]|uniref:tRNA (adenosine(37)-N6)-threonylcarbamoyltransferase complex ATPase subunit type 1 TsaE n=1 Tax=Leptolyngbya ohadii TaxID=1962290 RepID=UPI000B59A1EF|nr:tRNA (adenosine(37)-N6)-threonylcarbamoyltransferase complex ATPase subunit type 1 TsaE [Leptolyngbya ohadii]
MADLTVTLPSADATHQFGYRLGQFLPAGTVLLLEGNLGSGKTTLVQGLGQGLGVTEPIVSPTFTLISEYPEGRIPLYHLDLYRLEPIEVADLHLESYWDGAEFPLGIVAIEWAERLPELPTAYLQITLTPIEQGGRLAQLTANSIEGEAIWQELSALAKQSLKH